MAQRGPWWCGCEFPTVGHLFNFLPCRAIMPYFIRLLACKRASDNIRNIGHSMVRIIGQVIQGTAHAHRMLRHRCPPPPVRFRAVLRRSIPAMIQTSGTFGPQSCGSLVHYRQRVPSYGAGPSGTIGPFNVSEHQAGGGDIEANRGCPGHCPRRFHAQTSVSPTCRLGSRRCSGDPFRRCSSEPSQRCSGEASRRCFGEPSRWCSGTFPFESSRSLSQALWALSRAGASCTLGNLGRRWCGSIGILLLGLAGALEAIDNLGRRWCESFEQHRHLGAQMCGSLEQHRQLGASDVREPRAASVPWCFRCAGVSDTIGKLGHWLCESLGHHQHLGAWMRENLGDHRHLGAWMCESLSGIGNLGPWSCESLCAIGTIGNFGPWSCGSIGHHRQPRPLVVQEPLAPSALGHAEASGTIGTLVLGCAGASDTIGNLGPWSCGSIEHHWQPRPLVMREPRDHQHLGPWSCGSLRHHRQPRPLVVRESLAPSAPWCLGCTGASISIGTLVLGCAGASDNVGNLGRWMCGCLEQHGHPSASDPTTPGPGSLYRAKISWGGLCIAMGLSLACPFSPDMLRTPCASQIGDPSVPWPCQVLAYIRSCGVIGILCCVPKPDGIMDVFPSLLHLMPFGVHGGPQSCPVSRVCPLKSVWPRRCTGARSCFQMQKIFLRVEFRPLSLNDYAFCLLTRTMLVLCYDLFVAHVAC
ncbi:hypothetical protein GOBAR_AA12885 [Gossypium barbadense]|uniref:Uncharacterized protein n=1 Tax=Gossypium barbadense TaxID=3634 RepID=A0A2P5XWP9_GOSBA|nr:hypothetical protein GOBAR_AA12885 [Gossypium barbadense]